MVSEDISIDAITRAMKEFRYRIKNQAGICAGIAESLVNEAAKYSSEIKISTNGEEVEATKLIEIMVMEIKQGEQVTVRIEGDDENIAELELKEFFIANL